jgi:hypothetical protein
MSYNSTQQTEGTEHHRLTPSQISEALEYCLRARKVAMLHGDPGTAKTSLVGQKAVEWFGGKNAEEDKLAEYGENNSYFRKMILSQQEPSDALGLPFPDKATRSVVYFRPEMLPEEGEGIFLLDEFTQAPPVLQAPARQLLTERRFGPHKIGEGWLLVAAGNYPHNRAGANKLLTHVGSSLVHLHVIADLDDTCRVAVKRGWNPMVTAFLRFRPTLLAQFNPGTDTFPCPRTWEIVSKLIDTDPSPGIEHALYAGAVGEGAAAELVAFIRVYQDLPDIDALILNPEKAHVPRQDNVGTLYALASALSRRATAKNIGNVMKYLSRIPTEFNVFAIRDAVRRDQSLTKTRAFVDWATEHRDILID